MAQKSFPWTNNSTGDGTSGGYTALEWGEIWRQVFLGGNEASQGVCKGAGNELAVTGTSSPLSVNTGAALVYGKFYQNTASVNLTVTTPVVGTTGGHVILQLDWTAQTVRLVATRNTDGVNSTPSLTQSTSTQWEIRLATFTITTGGVITVTDARAYVHMSTRINKNNVDGLTAGGVVAFSDLNGRLTEDATNFVWDDTNDRLGISTNAPAAKLHTVDNSAGYSVEMQRTSATARAYGFGVAANGSLILDDITGSQRIMTAATGGAVTWATAHTFSAAAVFSSTVNSGRIAPLIGRQGGNASDWATAGTGNQSLAASYTQCGARSVTATAGNTASVTITFPVAFSGTPVCVAAMNSVNTTFNGVAVGIAGNSASTALITVANPTGSDITVTINWIAIGPA